MFIFRTISDLNKKSSFSSFWRNSFQSKKVNRVKKSYSIYFVECDTLINLINIPVVSFLLFISFPWRETKVCTRQVKVQIRKITLIILTLKGENADSGGKKKHLSITFLAHRLRLFHLTTEIVRTESVKNGHQIANTMNNNRNKRSKVPIVGKY